MSKKSQTKKASGSKGGGRAGKDDMPRGDMNQPVQSGLMEMPAGGETGGGKEGGGAPMSSSASSSGGSLMPGESPGATTGPQAGEMPGGSMTST